MPKSVRDNEMLVSHAIWLENLYSIAWLAAGVSFMLCFVVIC